MDEGADIAVSEGAANAATRNVAFDSRGMVGDEGAIEAAVAIGLRGFEHVDVAVVNEGLHVLGHSSANRAEMS